VMQLAQQHQTEPNQHSAAGQQLSAGTYAGKLVQALVPG
jgi:hypothetical protein